MGNRRFRSWSWTKPGQAPNLVKYQRIWDLNARRPRPLPYIYRLSQVRRPPISAAPGLRNTLPWGDSGRSSGSLLTRVGSLETTQIRNFSRKSIDPRHGFSAHLGCAGIAQYTPVGRLWEELWFAPDQSRIPGNHPNPELFSKIDRSQILSMSKLSFKLSEAPTHLGPGIETLDLRR